MDKASNLPPSQRVNYYEMFGLDKDKRVDSDRVEKAFNEVIKRINNEIANCTKEDVSKFLF